MGLNPDELTEEEWAQRFQEWAYVKAIERENQEMIFKKALFEVAAAIFRKN